MRSVLLVLAVILAAATPAQAGVMYRWETVSGPETRFLGYLEVTDEAYLAGSVFYHYDAVAWTKPGGPNDPNAPILAIVFWAEGYERLEVNNRFRDGSTGAEDEISSTFALSFSGDYLAGTFDTGGNENFLSMTAGSDLWTISTFFNFGERGTRWDCGSFGPVCEGVTGRWVLDRSTVPTAVSEPGTLLLLGIAALMLGRTRQWDVLNPGVRRKPASRSLQRP